MIVRRPASRSRAIVAFTPGAGGSMNPRNPTNASRPSAASSGAATGPQATPRTLRPPAARRWLTVSNCARPSPSSGSSPALVDIRSLRSMSRPGAPFTYATVAPSSRSNTAISLRVLENGRWPTPVSCVDAPIPSEEDQRRIAASMGSRTGPCVESSEWIGLLTAGAARNLRDTPQARLVACDRFPLNKVELRVRRPHAHDAHVAGGEGARLVRADDRGRSERLDRR